MLGSIRRKLNIKARWQALVNALVAGNRFVDYWILLPVFVLMILGLLMVYSASVADQFGSAVEYLRKQFFVDFLAAVTMYSLYRFKFRWHSKMTMQFFRGATVITLAGMAYALIFGPTINGAKGWIQLPLMTIQPVEFYKVGLILVFSYVLSHEFRPNQLAPTKKSFYGWRVITASYLLVGVAFEFLMPDIGGLAIILLIMIVLVMTSGIIFQSAFIFIGLVAVGYMGIHPLVTHLIKTNSPLLGEYWFQRFVAFVDPFSNASGAGHQLVNSLYAISNGGIFGRGLGNSLQKMGNLPEANTDFIMAVVAEELGMLGVLGILFLTGVIIYRLMTWGIRSHSMLYRLVLFGIAAYLFAQVFINFGGVIGVLPITGVTFPFISAGGSSTLSLGIAFGIAFNIIKQLKFERSQRGK